MMFPLVLDLAADGIAVAVACRVLGFTKQAFYAWKKRPFSDRDWDDAHLTNAAFDAHREDPTFGYRLLADELEQAGHVASERRVWRICSQQRIWSAFAKKRCLTRKAGPPVHDDLVKREFTADHLDQLWLTLNTRPRKSLDWKTPAEALNEQLLLLQQLGVATTG